LIDRLTGVICDVWLGGVCGFDGHSQVRQTRLASWLQAWRTWSQPQQRTCTGPTITLHYHCYQCCFWLTLLSSRGKKTRNL